jgi:hypothetical protein
MVDFDSQQDPTIRRFYIRMAQHAVIFGFWQGRSRFDAAGVS